MEVLILKGRETPQADGRPETRVGFSPGKLLAEVTKHRHVAWRSAVVAAALFRLRTPLQQAAGTVPPFLRYDMHGNT